VRSLILVAVELQGKLTSLGTKLPLGTSTWWSFKQKWALKLDAGIAWQVMANLDHSKQVLIVRNLEYQVCEAYKFIVENYHAGDQIFLFGFSRGATIVRILAAMLQTVSSVNYE
jgi:hypothetical protein